MHDSLKLRGITTQNVAYDLAKICVFQVPTPFKVFYEGDTSQCDSLPCFLHKKAQDASLPVRLNEHT